MPERLAVAAPVTTERPARERFAGIPFALAIVDDTARREAVAKAPGVQISNRSGLLT